MKLNSPNVAAFKLVSRNLLSLFMTQIFNNLKILKTHINSFMKKLADGQFVARISRKEVLMSCIDILKRPHASKKKFGQRCNNSWYSGSFLK